MAHQSAHDALVAVLAKLDDFRGESRFTTWAYKFALLEAGVKMRRRAWNDREVTLEPAGWPGFADPGSSPHHDAQMAELLSAVGAAIAEDLTPHQREVLVAVTLDDVPIDVLAERLQTTRGALYKTLHDARRRLRACLAARGLDPDLQDRGPLAMSHPEHDDLLRLRRVLGPAGPELTCEQCFEQLDRHVELTLAGADADAAVPGMSAHLEGCPACKEDHESLLALVAADAGHDDAA